MRDWRQYIIEQAQKRGMDPDVVLRVVDHEGGTKDPIRQSLVRKNGIQEPSYGPFQMLVGGGDTGFPEGLGNDFMKATGLDPRNPDHADEAIQYSLDTANRDGWGRWYGAKAAGVGMRDGTTGKPLGLTIDSVPGGVASTGNAPMLPDPIEVKSHPVKGVETPTTELALGDKIGNSIFGEDMAAKLKGLFGEGASANPASAGLSLMSKAVQKQAPQDTPIQTGLLAASANEDAGRMQAAQQMMAALMASKRKPGMTMMGRAIG